MTPYHFCYVYVLKSLRFARLYIGYTADLRKRLSQHNKGESRYTTRFKPWQLVYYEAFSTARAAQRREASLKHNGNPMRELKKRIGVESDAKVVRGFTLIETLVAVLLLSIAVVAPMTLASKSLSSAHYARDQITAYYLAQEAIEALRAIRDAQILVIAQSASGAPDIFASIPHNSAPFIIDARKTDPTSSIALCPVGAGQKCRVLQTDGLLYGYDFCSDNSCNTYFIRTVRACFIQSTGACTSVNSDELRVTVEVEWKTGPIQTRRFSISENLYRWISDGSAVE